MRKQANHLQKAKDKGGINSVPPLATTKFDAIKIGWINKSENAKKLLAFMPNDLLSD